MIHNSKQIAILSFLCCFHSNSAVKKTCYGRTMDGRTHGPTDGPTDKASYRYAWMHLKTKNRFFSADGGREIYMLCDPSFCRHCRLCGIKCGNCKACEHLLDHCQTKTAARPRPLLDQDHCQTTAGPRITNGLTEQFKVTMNKPAC